LSIEVRDSSTRAVLLERSFALDDEGSDPARIEDIDLHALSGRQVEIWFSTAFEPDEGESIGLLDPVMRILPPPDSAGDLP
jgi:hypothetical protein